MVGKKRADIKFANGRHVNTLAVRRHLGQQLGLLLPEIMKYISHRGLEVSITAEERPWRLELVWQRKNKKPLGLLWHRRIRDFLASKLTPEANLFQPPRVVESSPFICTTELRLEDVSPFVVKDDNDEYRDPHFPSVSK
ncbi:MAG: hypothetical protein WCV69_00965 [Patescibacteria group bacterium]|jgi:hypothetical protein